MEKNDERIAISFHLTSSSPTPGFAGLDVYENERPFFFKDHSLTIIPDHLLSRLSSMPNVILTGHQAYLTKDALEEIARVTMKNVTDYFWRDAKQPLENQVLDEWKIAQASKSNL